MPVSKSRPLRRSFLSLTAVLAIAGCPFSFAQEEAAESPESIPPSVVQEKVREWVRTKKQISAERADWEAQKQSMTDLNELRQREIEKLDEIIEAAGSRLADAEKQRAEMLAEEETLREKRQLLEAEIAEAEAQLRAVVPTFPEPLKAKIHEALGRLENQGADASLQDRYRDLLTILGEAGNFDHTITVDSELRDIAGEQVEVDVLYLGLARAWYVDRSGAHAGTGIPSAEGWQWTEDRSVAVAVRNAIAVRRKEAPPAIVSLPFPSKSNAAAK